MRNRPCLWIVLVLALASFPALAAEPQAGSAAATTPPPVVLAGQSLAPDNQSCSTPAGAIPVGDSGLILLNAPPGPLDPTLLGGAVLCNCTRANTCGSCGPGPCIPCAAGTCLARPCLSTSNSCKNGVCGQDPP